jgi:hypothetical protein
MELGWPEGQGYCDCLSFKRGGWKTNKIVASARNDNNRMAFPSGVCPVET